jgi:hypothetical protein
MNGRSYYRWLTSLITTIPIIIRHVKGHTDNIDTPSRLNAEADHYASTAQDYINLIPIAPIPTFDMDEYTLYSAQDGWIESNIPHLVQTHMERNTAHTLSFGHHERMISWIYELRTPNDFPYLRAYSAYSATVQLYARSGQLALADTLHNRGQLSNGHCRFGCPTIEDMHHLFVECKHYEVWRQETSVQLRMRTMDKLTEKGLPTHEQEPLLHTAESLFIDSSNVWPLHHSFYYLGHIPKLDPLLSTSSLSDFSKNRLLYNIASDWHTIAIRLAGRIFGDYQRAMAKRNDPYKRRGKL